MAVSFRSTMFGAFAACALALGGCKDGEPLGQKIGAAITPTCHECGTVSAMQRMKEKGDATGAGAVIGAVAGAVIGHQFGSGRGNDAATATGAIAGGITGHQVERRINSNVWYRVTVAMEDGGTRTIDLAPDQATGLAVGSKVKVNGDRLEVASR